MSDLSAPTPEPPPAGGAPAQGWIERVFITRRFFALFNVQVISALGDWVGFFAITSLAASISTQPEAAIALVTTARVAPGIFLAPFIGVIVESVQAQLDLVLAEHHVKHVHEVGVHEQGRHAPPDVEWMVNHREDVDNTLEEAADNARGAGVDVMVFARQGDPADAILDVAEETGSDLIVVGNKGMTGAKRFLLGSVPNKISHHAPCSVLIIRTT